MRNGTNGFNSGQRMKRRTLVKCACAVGVVGLVVSFVFPIFMRATLTTASNACINNLRQIDGAKQQWALQTHSRSNDIPTMGNLQPYLGRGSNGSLPVCPLGGTYTPGRLGKDPTCSIADSSWPNEHVLTGTNTWWTDFKCAWRALLKKHSNASTP